MRVREKILWACLVLPLVISIFMVEKVVASPITVYVDPPRILDLTMVPGTQFTVNISVDYVENLWGWQFDLHYDPNVLKGISFQMGPFLGSAGGTVHGPFFELTEKFNNTKGELGLAAAFLQEAKKPEVSPDGGGVLASVTFEVLSFGGSHITLGPRTGLLDTYGNWLVGGLRFDKDKGEWIIVAPTDLYPTEPKFLEHSYFDNRPQVYVDPPKVQGIEVGENFTINVKVDNVEDLYSWSFFMRWNASILNVTSAVEGEFLKREGRTTSFTWQSNNTGGYLNVDCVIEGGVGVSGNGTLVAISFTVKGEGNTTLSFYDISFLDSSGEEILVGAEIGEGWFNNVKFHNVAVYSVTPYPTEVEVGSGGVISVNVTVVNTGSFNETNLVVSAYRDGNMIGESKTIDILEKGANVTLTFTWDTTGVKMGFYTLKANVTFVEEEADVEDNTFTYGAVTISGHNLAIASATIPVSELYKGTNLTITVVVKNLGTVTETFNVTTYYDSVPIETKTVESLHGQASQTLTFIWDARDVAEDIYTLSVNVSVVEGEENVADNSYLIGTIEVLELVEPFPTELFLVSLTAVAVIGVTVVVLIRGKKPEASWEEVASPISEYSSILEDGF